MRLRPQLAVFLLVLQAASAQVVDRMVAVVNKHVVLESELDQTTRVECLMQGKSLEKITPADVASVLERLIDRSLLEQQIMKGAEVDPTPKDVAAQLKELRAQVPDAATEEGWNRLLTSYGLTQSDVEDYLSSQLRILRFVDLRFRGLVRVDKNAISSYYEQKFLPELRKSGAAEPPLTEVSGKIEKILIEQSIDDMLNRWLETLRSQAHIEKLSPPGERVASGERP
jgi:parvulin-like peptidyl-prolyl isomerase